MLAEHEGVKVVGQTGDAREAIAEIRQVQPEVVILAIHMYMGSGIEVLRTVRQELPTAVIIIMTNSAYPQYRRECLRAGANYFFDKSIEFENINTIFDQLVQGERAVRQEGTGQGRQKSRNTEHKRAA